MGILYFMALAWWGATVIAMIVATAAAIAHPRWRLNRHLTTTRQASTQHKLAPLSLVRPLAGQEANMDGLLDSIFEQTHPDYEILLSIATPVDAARPAAENAIARHQSQLPYRRPNLRSSQLVVGERPFQNAKLRNMALPIEAAKNEFVLCSDSNVMMPPDFAAHIQSLAGDGGALVSSYPIGIMPAGFSAWLECAFLNQHHTRWLLLGDMMGGGVALGKTLLFTKTDLNRMGGLDCVGNYLAEDIGLTKCAKRANIKVIQADRYTPVPLGRRHLKSVWQRQNRWGQIRWKSQHSYHLGEFSIGMLPSGLAGLFSVPQIWDISPLAFCAMHAALWIICDFLLSRFRKWPYGWQSPLATLVREFMQPALLVVSVFSRHSDWRGKTFQTGP